MIRFKNLEKSYLGSSCTGFHELSIYSKFLVGDLAPSRELFADGTGYPSLNHLLLVFQNLLASLRESQGTDILDVDLDLLRLLDSDLAASLDLFVGGVCCVIAAAFFLVRNDQFAVVFDDIKFGCIKSFH